MTEKETELQILKNQRDELDIKIAILENEIIESETDLVKKYEQWSSKDKHDSYRYIPNCIKGGVADSWYEDRYKSASLIKLITNHCEREDIELEQFINENPEFIKAVIEENVDEFKWDW